MTDQTVAAPPSAAAEASGGGSLMRWLALAGLV